MRRLIAGTLAAISLAGCVPPSPEAYGPPPANYREIVAEQIRANFFDPASLQDVWISAPFQGPKVPAAVLAPGWIVCLRANGKNRLGAYAGRQQYGYVIHDGAVVQEGVGGLTGCDTAKYDEWTEMEMSGAGRGVVRP
jgi:hypothetical protein